MKKTNEQLTKELAELQKKYDDLEKCHIELARENNKTCRQLLDVTANLESKTKLCDALHKKYEQQSPEVVIVGILEGLEIPEQVALLKQITAKKVTQFCTALEKYEQAAKFYRNNVADLKDSLRRAADEDIVTMPAR